MSKYATKNRIKFFMKPSSLIYSTNHKKNQRARNVLIPLQDLQDMARQLERLLEAETRAGKETTGLMSLLGVWLQLNKASFGGQKLTNLIHEELFSQ